MTAISNRMEKINSLLLTELAKLIQNLGFTDRLITVLDLVTTSDFAESKIWLGVVYYNNISLEDKKKKDKEIINVLNSMSFQFRQVLMKKLKLRKIPKLIYKIDDNPEKAEKIDQLLDSI